jgi:hypothetical protein
MAKAGGETTTAWIRHSPAKALSSEYLGDPEFVAREFLKGLAAGEIPWRCARFEAPERYSGPGPGDPKFWETDPDQPCTDYGPIVIVQLRGVHIKGDSAKRIDGAAAYGIELDRSALIRLKLLPRDDVLPGQSQAKRLAPKRLIEAEVKRRAAAGERYDSIKDVSLDLHEWLKTIGAKPLAPRTIENYLRGDLFRLLSKK